MRRQFGLVVCVAFVVAVVGASVARATPNTTQYGNPATTAAPAVTSHVSGAKTHKASTPKTAVPTVKAVTTPKQTLPFTGLSLLAFALVGGALVLLGLGLRRTATSRVRSRARR